MATYINNNDDDDQLTGSEQTERESYSHTTLIVSGRLEMKI